MRVALHAKKVHFGFFIRMSVSETEKINFQFL